MGKILGLLVGAIMLIIGIILLVVWWYEFLFMLRGIVPGMLILCGLVAVIAGFSELKDTMKSKS